MPKVSGPKRPNQSMPEEQYPIDQRYGYQQPPSYPPQQETEYPQYPPQFPPQQEWQQPPMQPHQPPKKRSRRNLWIAIVAIILIVFATVGILRQFTASTPTNPIPQAGKPTTVIDSAQQTATDTSFQQTAVAVSNSWMTDTPTVSPTTPIPTKTQAQIESDYKASAVSATVASLDKDGSADTGKTVHFTATILNFVKDSSGITAGANVTTSDTSSVIQVVFSSGTDITQLNQGDTIEVWGTDDGTFSGTNAYGGTVQEVGISATYLFDHTTNYQANA
jgi:hypothetical protein